MSVIKRAIEVDFPFPQVSRVAEAESWRKELNRPLSHIHKWWAQRLGSVFRAILLGACTPAATDIWESFYRKARFEDVTVFDPFMGSGTTLIEARKVGCRVIGRDINPVAYFLVKNALNTLPLKAVTETFREIEADTAPILRQYFQTRLSGGETAEVLYYFWVKYLPCPKCNFRIDLFDSRIFARHAAPARNPNGQALCPFCDAITTVNIHQESVRCIGCRQSYTIKTGAVKGSKATCPSCRHEFVMVKHLETRDVPPDERIYAMMVLLPDGKKAYLSPTEFDHHLYEKAVDELAEKRNWYPVVPVQPGNNTNQALRYNYRFWHQMFNARQLLCLGYLAQRIRAIPDESQRLLFTCLLSSVLEFNNCFCSFKGEGTGAVRHMFAHHILKPERTPLEANVWGTPRSSGSFSTLFNSRIKRALRYRDAPFELAAVQRNGRVGGRKVFALSPSLSVSIANNYDEFLAGEHSVYLSCGDSSQTDLPNEAVDLVVTDPPFFDNVHYSELADFFYVWQRQILGEEGTWSAATTRNADEVQDKDAPAFARKLGDVFSECHRILKHNGLFIFTYHHSRAEGWQSLLIALHKGNFEIEAVYPVKSEMSVGRPKLQAKEPIDIDIIFVCRKRDCQNLQAAETAPLLDGVKERTTQMVGRLNTSGRRLGRNDIQVIVMSHLLMPLSHMPLEKALAYLQDHQTFFDRMQVECWEAQEIKNRQEQTLFDL